jgi:hypothetical protein
VRRAGRLGDGWYGMPDDRPAILEELEKAGRAGTPFEFSTITLQGPMPLDELQALADIGVDRVVVTPWPDTKVGTVGREGLAAVEQYAKEIGLQP